ncbi:hypothetical protein DXG01_009579, partial [Tephrocybe rancida]
LLTGALHYPPPQHIMAPQDDPEQKEKRQRGAKGQTLSGGEPQAPSKRQRAATSTQRKAETTRAACTAPSNANRHPKQPNTGAPRATRYATPAPPPATPPNQRTNDDNQHAESMGTPPTATSAPQHDDDAPPPTTRHPHTTT